MKFKINLDDDAYSIYHGKVFDISRAGFLGIQIDENDGRMDYPFGVTFFIDRRSVLQIYSSKYVEHLTPRLALKHLWKDLVFREVKTSICSNLLHVEYKYISKTGFERVKRFPNLEIAYANVIPEYHKNIVPYYNDYFGFSTDKALRSNDNHYDREVFFSKKCYTELDWSSNPTGDFMIVEKGFNMINPIADTLICGIVENGEKGLFYRKWFVCSKEFLTLWTMVCDSSHSSLIENSGVVDEDASKLVWTTPPKKGSKKKIKCFETLLKDLDTSSYSVNMKLDLERRRKKHCIYNLERTALYFSNRYKQIAEVLFSRGLFSESNSDEFEEYDEFQENLAKNLLWPKRLD